MSTRFIIDAINHVDSESGLKLGWCTPTFPSIYTSPAIWRGVVALSVRCVENTRMSAEISRDIERRAQIFFVSWHEDVMSACHETLKSGVPLPKNGVILALNPKDGPFDNRV